MKTLRLSLLDPYVLQGCYVNWGWKIQQNSETAIRQTLTWPRLDLNCWAAPDVLLHLRHALPGCLIGVVCSTNCDLVLNAALALQVIPSLPVWRRERKKKHLRFQARTSSGLAHLILDSCCLVLHAFNLQSDSCQRLNWVPIFQSITLNNKCAVYITITIRLVE